MTNLIHPRLVPISLVADVMVHVAELAAAEARKAVRVKRRGYLVRRPGPESPLWNACAQLVRDEVRTYGAKARLARYLGLPRQRLQDYLKAGSRLPDAEMALQMLYWAVAKRTGRDLSL